MNVVKSSEEVLVMLQNKEARIKELIKTNKNLKSLGELKDNYLICSLSDNDSEKNDFYVENGVEFDEVNSRSLVNRVHYLRLRKLDLERMLNLLEIDYNDNFIKTYFNLTVEQISYCKKLHNERQKEDVDIYLVRSFKNNINEFFSLHNRLFEGVDVEIIQNEINNLRGDNNG